ncbi:hypothetical protein [Thermocatellispora tengchongensis]|uniref:hypothetical protein n=1 Tax=Thermocatellispora tengchongensis TaxID=1073253 RepID=UPI00363EC080
MIQRPEALVVMARETYRMSFDDERRERLVRLAVVREPVFVTELDSPAARERLATADVLVTGWGCPR